MINLIAKFVEIGNSEVGEIAWTYLCYEVQIEICNADLIDDKWREERNIHNMISDELGFDTYNLFLIKTGSEYYLLRTLISDYVYIDDSADDVYEIIENEEEEDEIILKSNVSIDDALEWLKTLTVITISDVEKNEKLNKYYWDGSSE